MLSVQIDDSLSIPHIDWQQMSTSLRIWIPKSHIHPFLLFIFVKVIRVQVCFGFDLTVRLMQNSEFSNIFLLYIFLHQIVKTSTNSPELSQSSVTQKYQDAYLETQNGQNIRKKRNQIGNSTITYFLHAYIFWKGSLWSEIKLFRCKFLISLLWRNGGISKVVTAFRHSSPRF